MVCALAFGLRGLGSSPDQGHCVVFFGRHITLTVPLSNQVYKWVPTDLMLGTTLRWGLLKPERGADLMVHLARIQTSSYFVSYHFR